MTPDLDFQNFFGQMLSLQLAVKEFRNEVTIDLCEESPRVVMMALTDLQCRVDTLVELVQTQINNRNIDNEQVHDTARELMTIIPPCLVDANSSEIVAYRVGLMKLAEKITGETVAQADMNTVEKMLKEQPHGKTPGVAWTEIAKSAYKAHIAYTEGHCEKCDQSPEFEDLSESEQLAWQATVRQVGYTFQYPNESLGDESRWANWIAP